ncbi:MAG: EamA family transporter [bacterium]|nr:EamA family transporter [bacterium]
MWFFYALLSAMSAALVAIFGKLGLGAIDSTLATTIRAIIMAVFLVAVSLALKKFQGFTPSSLATRDWLLIAAAGIAGALSWLFYIAALKLGLASRVAAIDRLSIVFVIFLAALFLGESLTWKSAIGALAIAGGAVLITIK